MVKNFQKANGYVCVLGMPSSKMSGGELWPSSPSQPALYPDSHMVFKTYPMQSWRGCTKPAAVARGAESPKAATDLAGKGRAASHAGSACAFATVKCDPGRACK